MKETYRVNKLELIETVKQKDIKIRILLSLTPTAYNSFDKINFDKLSGNMKTLLAKVQASLE